MSETSEKPKSKVDSFIDRVRATHKPGPNGNCEGCEQSSAWPCDAANLLLVVDNLAQRFDATFANNRAMIQQLLEIEDVLNPLLSADPPVDFQPAVYLREAEEVGGRSKWAMRYADEAGQYQHFKRRADGKFAKIREILARTRVR